MTLIDNFCLQNAPRTAKYVAVPQYAQRVRTDTARTMPACVCVSTCTGYHIGNPLNEKV